VEVVTLNSILNSKRACFFFSVLVFRYIMSNTKQRVIFGYRYVF
jgi:hypothetical protein